jgi:hypothetical protein
MYVHGGVPALNNEDGNGKQPDAAIEYDKFFMSPL